MTGRTPRITGGGGFPMPFAEAKAEISRVMPAIVACHVSTEHDPPKHEDVWLAMDAAPSGELTRVAVVGKSEHPKFEACMISALKQTRWPTTPKGFKSAKVIFSAPIDK